MRQQALLGPQLAECLRNSSFRVVGIETILMMDLNRRVPQPRLMALLHGVDFGGRHGQAAGLATTPEMAHRPLLLVLIGLVGFGLPAWAQTQIQLRCSGTVLNSQGDAERWRATEHLQVSLGVRAQAKTADAALAELQARLAAVRSALQRLQVEKLEVSSPSTWRRPAREGQPRAVEASLTVRGQVKPARLQELVRSVGVLPGVRLAPVSTRADERQDREVRRQLLQLAYQDALSQAQDLAAAIGKSRLEPMEVRVQSSGRPVPMRALAAGDKAVPPFDPDELPAPTDRLQLQVRFCAR